MTDRNLLSVVKHIGELPTLPHVAAKLTALVRNPRVSASDVGQAIAADQAMTTRVLRLVNSAYYGFPRKISTIQQAVVILGFNAVKNLVLGASVFDLFRSRNGTLDRYELWVHSVGCGIAAKMIVGKTRGADPEEAFTAGILHDVGKVIIDTSLGDQARRIDELVAAGEVSRYEAEQQVLGVSHATIGRWGAEQWNLPTPLTQAIAHHHQPSRAEESKIGVCAIAVADRVCRQIGMGSGGDALVPEVEPQALDTVRLTQEDLPALGEEVLAETKKAEAFFAAGAEAPR